jgi:hypothetical protein
MTDLVPIFAGVETYPRSAHTTPPITRPGQVVGLYIPRVAQRGYLTEQ